MPDYGAVSRTILVGKRRIGLPVTDVSDVLSLWRFCSVMQK